MEIPKYVSESVMEKLKSRTGKRDCAGLEWGESETDYNIKWCGQVGPY